MFSKKNLKSALIVTAIGMTSANLMANDFYGNKDNLKEFRVCKPYAENVRGLNDQILNFEDQVLSPLERELSTRSSRVNNRASDERKLEKVVSSIKYEINSGEGRLVSNPSTIKTNIARMSQARQEISSLTQSIAGYERELEDAGFFKRGKLKRKIKKANKDINRANDTIVNLTRSNENMAREIQTLPAAIEANRGRLVSAEANLAEMRNRVPTLASLRDEERAVQNRLDSQEDIRRDLSRELVFAQQNFTGCRIIKENADTYVALHQMVKRLKAANCDAELVRRRLPYDVPKTTLRALGEADRLVCPEVAPIVNNQ